MKPWGPGVGAYGVDEMGIQGFKAMLKLYELVGKDDLRFSPYCWRVRLALAHKELEAELVPCTHNDTKTLAFTGQIKVPVLVDDDRVILDSWAIACYLDDAYSDRPALMNGSQGRALTRLVNIWADTQLDQPVLRTVLLDVYNHLNPNVDKAQFRVTREARFGRTLEEMQANREEELALFNRNLAPLRELLKNQKWISGEAPAYADYIVFGSLQFPRCITDFSFVAKDDPVYEWRSRMIGLFDGLADTVPAYDR